MNNHVEESSKAKHYWYCLFVILLSFDAGWNVNSMAEVKQAVMSKRCEELF